MQGSPVTHFFEILSEVAWLEIETGLTEDAVDNHEVSTNSDNGDPTSPTS